MQLTKIFPLVLALIAVVEIAATASAANAPDQAKGRQQLAAVIAAAQARSDARALDCTKHSKDPRCKK
ncbi:MAG TPA: hypothetical protein VNE59_15970 [Burkholderiales bacterium]|nr:hypothetical protein [Burkholderiales bacterium]